MSEGNNFHSYCPVGADSWCQYQRDIVNKTNLCKPGAGIAPDVIKEIKPIYAGLTKDDDLPKRLYGITQNANEFKCFVLATCPKKYLLWN